LVGARIAEGEAYGVPQENHRLTATVGTQSDIDGGERRRPFLRGCRGGLQYLVLRVEQYRLHVDELSGYPGQAVQARQELENMQVKLERQHNQKEFDRSLRRPARIA